MEQSRTGRGRWPRRKSDYDLTKSIQIALYGATMRTDGAITRPIQWTAAAAGSYGRVKSDKQVEDHWKSYLSLCAHKNEERENSHLDIVINCRLITSSMELIGCD